MQIYGIKEKSECIKRTWSKEYSFSRMIKGKTSLLKKYYLWDLYIIWRFNRLIYSK